MALTKVDQTMVSDQVFGRRNLFINGKMQVAQRFTSNSSVTSTDYWTVDRWETAISSAGVWTISQSTTVPSGEGFAYSQKFECTTADSSLSAGDYLIWRQKIEGINLQHLKYGTSSAEKLTLSFWVRSAKTGTYIVEFYNNNSAGIKLQSQSYTISSADTWEKKTITIDGDTALAFQNTTDAELLVYWWLAAGSTYSGGGSLNTSWNSSVANNTRAVGVVNLADSTSNDWYITGVQLEVGDKATPFEHLSYGEELALCQRYCFAACTEGEAGSGASNVQIGIGSFYTDTQIETVVHFPTAMRISPTLLANSGSSYFISETNAGGQGFNSWTGVYGAGKNQKLIYSSGTVSDFNNQGMATRLAVQNSSAYVIFEAEL